MLSDPDEPENREETTDWRVWRAWRDGSGSRKPIRTVRDPGTEKTGARAQDAQARPGGLSWREIRAETRAFFELTKKTELSPSELRAEVRKLTGKTGLSRAEALAEVHALRKLTGKTGLSRAAIDAMREAARRNASPKTVKRRDIEGRAKRLKLMERELEARERRVAAREAAAFAPRSKPRPPGSLENVEQAIVRNYGNVTRAAHELGMTAPDLRRLLAAEPLLYEAALEGAERAMDEAEAALRDGIRAQEPQHRIAAAGYYLTHSKPGRARGWGRARVDIEMRWDDEVELPAHFVLGSSVSRETEGG